MADFQVSFNRTLDHEGGYADVPGDRGGETYRGISRKWHPGWPGWLIIDEHKPIGPDFENKIAAPLAPLTEDFYRAEFWKPLYGGEIGSQIVADELFDTAVLMGRKWAVKFLQRGLNALNQNQVFYPDINVDGRTGPATLQALKKCLSHNGDTLLVKIQDGLQLGRFINLMDKYPKQEKFARGWIEHRIMIGKV